MKILHVGNQCGVASTLGIYMDQEYGTYTTVLERAENDPYGHTEPGILVKGHLKFLARAIFEAKATDVIHIHSHDRLLQPLGLSHHPVIMHYHGSEIRGRWIEKERQWSKAAKILVSTRDLLEGAPDAVIYFPNPVSYRFNPDGVRPPRDCAVSFSYGADDLSAEIAKEHELPLITVKKPIPHREMPVLLRNYTHFIEAKRVGGREIMGSVEDTGSLTSLEALACGLKVLCRDGEREGLPPEHRPKEAVERLIKIYEEVEP